MSRLCLARLLPLVAPLFASGLTGCDQFFYPQHQIVAVASTSGTGDVKGARCTLSNDKRTWFATTPATVTLLRSDQPLFVTCSKQGYVTTTILTQPATKTEMFGALVSGGLLDTSTDARTGRTSAYAPRIVVKLIPDSERPPAPPV